MLTFARPSHIYLWILVSYPQAGEKRKAELLALIPPNQLPQQVPPKQEAMEQYGQPQPEFAQEQQTIPENVPQATEQPAEGNKPPKLYVV